MMMTPTDLSMFVLLAAALLFAGVRQLIEAGPDLVTADPVAPYEAPFREPGSALPERPPGMASFKAEIQLTPAGRHRAPELRVRKAHQDWPWDTAEFEMRWDSFFEGLPDDLAVHREWAGSGR